MNQQIDRAYRFLLLCWAAGERSRARIWAHRMTTLVQERNRFKAIINA